MFVLEKETQMRGHMYIHTHNVPCIFVLSDRFTLLQGLNTPICQDIFST